MSLDAAGASGLEQFTLLAKNARGRACVALVQQVLSNRKLFVFRELLDMPNVAALRESPENAGYYELLRIFCFGGVRDFLARKDELPSLTPQQLHKLRKLTVVSLAHRHKLVPYDVLMEELDVATVRELEDILIDTIYSGLVQGKLDQKSRSFVVKYAVGRDTQDEDIDEMIAKLVSWRNESAAICATINDILAFAEGQAESESTRDEAIRAKMASRANSERGKMYQGGSGSAAGYRGGEDYPLFSESGYGSRRGPPGGKQRMHGTTRKSRS
ncbi:hypothetical protein PybrP1_001119 [[Pythium] brassicae (nom. inval.)]|nr:hypothetical protein PybrP1_001119 [[Pythium] brassicae (nom. inval.)]